MYRRTCILTILLVCLLSLALPVIAQEKKPITNADIVAMVREGFPETNVIGSIQQNPAKYDTSPLALIELKKQGVSQKIIDAMLQAGAPVQPAPPQTGNPLSTQQGASPAAGMGAVVFIDTTGRTEMKYSPNDMNIGIGVMDVVNPFGSSKIKSVFKGTRARLRTTTVSPSFEASITTNAYPADQIALVRFSVKSDKREIETGKIKMASGSSGFNKKDVVPIVIEEIKEQNASGSFYKRYTVKTVNALSPGEYAFVVSGMYYDLGVDPLN